MSIQVSMKCHCCNTEVSVSVGEQAGTQEQDVHSQVEAEAGPVCIEEVEEEDDLLWLKYTGPGAISLTWQGREIWSGYVRNIQNPIQDIAETISPEVFDTTRLAVQSTWINNSIVFLDHLRPIIAVKI